MNKISVIVLTYNPLYELLLRTIKSIIYQKGIDIELIISDDCSEPSNDSLQKIELFLKKNNFLCYKISKLKINVGTVKNFLNGLSFASCKYTKVLGQSDLLYDEYTLRDMYEFISEKESSLVFGNYACFNYVDNKIHLVQKEMLPRDINAYINKDRYRIKRNLVLLCDIMPGAAVIYDSEIVKKYIIEFGDESKLAEDYLTRIMAIKGEKIDYMNRNVLMYEWGTGTSTSGKPNFSNRLNIDLMNVDKVLLKLSDDLAYKKELYEVFEYHNNPIAKKKKMIPFYLRHIDILIFRIKRVFFRRNSLMKYDSSFINKII